MFLFLGAKPDFALHWHLWNYQYARAYDDESRAFQYGFRDTIGDSFRWLDREAPADAPTSMKVPLTVSDLWGPPSIWVAQPSGMVTFFKQKRFCFRPSEFHFKSRIFENAIKYILMFLL